MARSLYLALAALLAIGTGCSRSKPEGESLNSVRMSPDNLPLKIWMSANATTALNASDYEKLNRVFGRVKSFRPNEAEFAPWDAIADTGAMAARSKDLEGVRHACKSCHDTLRSPYRSRARVRSK